MMTDKELQEEIREEIEDLKKEIEEGVHRIFDLKNDLTKHRKALYCNHLWSDSKPFKVGTTTYKLTICSRCGYETNLRKA